MRRAILLLLVLVTGGWAQTLSPPEVSTTNAGLMSAADKTKLDGLAPGGDISAVYAGNGLTGGGTSGDVTLTAVGVTAGPISVTVSGISLTFDSTLKVASSLLGFNLGNQNSWTADQQFSQVGIGVDPTIPFDCYHSGTGTFGHIVCDNLGGATGLNIEMQVASSAGLGVGQIGAASNHILFAGGRANLSILGSNTVIGSSGAGSAKLDVTGDILASTDITATSRLYAAGGSAAAPSHTFGSDIDTGAYSDAANTYSLATAGVERIKFYTGAVVLNDGSNDYDVRVEGDTDANLMLLDAGTDTVQFGTNAGGGLAKVVISPPAASSGTARSFAVYGAAHTGQTASTEVGSVFFDLSQTRTWATGGITNQREIKINAPTYAFSGASTITNAATVYIDKAPVAGTNATITNNYALWVDAGNARFDGEIISTPSASAPAATGGIKVDSSTGVDKLSFKNNTGNAMLLLDTFTAGVTQGFVASNQLTQTYNITATYNSAVLLDTNNSALVVQGPPTSTVIVTNNNQAGSVVNQRDEAGTGTASSWYYLYIIYDGTTQGFLLSLSSTSPTMPTASYKWKTLVGAVRLDSNKYVVPYLQQQKTVSYYYGFNDCLVFNGTPADTNYHTASAAAFVPPISRKAWIYSEMGSTAGLSIGTFGATGSPSTEFQTRFVNDRQNDFTCDTWVILNSSQQFDYKSSQTSTYFDAAVRGYEIQ